ncbi:MAG: hypothetical protein JWL86_6722 [Rhizobium sp.]|nr:hypothetical protein [Rhizobium sp.]
MDDPNINPGWDAFMGEDTNSGVIRLVASVIVFAVAGGTLFWLIG